MAGRSLKTLCDDWRRALRPGVVALLCLLWPHPVAAVLQFDVFLGFDGVVRESSWFPVVCEIRNDGPPITGFIEVSSSGAKSQSQILPVELPTGTLKRITIPAFAYHRYSALWDVRLLSDRKKVIEERTGLSATRQLDSETRLMGSLSRTASGKPVFQPILRQQGGQEPVVSRLHPLIFPDNPLVLEAMHALYLSSEVAGSLTSPQVNALLGWLHSGGHLIVGIEQISDVNALPWLRGILPCDLKDTGVVQNHSQFQDWLQSGEFLNQTTSTSMSRARSTAAGMSANRPFSNLAADSKFELADLPVVLCTPREARVVLKSAQTPLMMVANRGKGRVTALPFSPEREPFKSWKHLPAFWSALAEVPGELYVSTDYYAGFGRSADAIFGAMIDSRQVHKLPKGWLFALLVVYLVVIGPFDQWWLKRIRKPMLTWITFPCYVALFSALMYVIGYQLRSGESECNELHIVDVLANGDRTELRGRTFASIYSPANATFALQSAEKPATLRGEILSTGGGMATEAFETVLAGDTFKAEVFVPVWTSQMFVSDWWRSAPAPVTLEARTQPGAMWAVRARNTGKQTVASAMVVIGNRVVNVGELAPGQLRDFAVNATSGLSLEEFVQANGGQFPHVVESRLAAFGDSERGSLTDLPNSSMAASFVRQLGGRGDYSMFVTVPGLDLSSVAARDNAVLLAWMPDHAPTKSLNQVNSKRSFRHTLWRVTSPIHH